MIPFKHWLDSIAGSKSLEELRDVLNEMIEDIIDEQNKHIYMLKSTRFYHRLDWSTFPKFSKKKPVSISECIASYDDENILLYDPEMHQFIIERRDVWTS